MSININSTRECKIAYIEYCQGKTTALTGAELGQIEKIYAKELPKWQNIASESRDISDYIIDDSDLDVAIEKGFKEGQEKTGFDGNTDKSIGRGVGDGVWTLASTAAQTTAMVTAKEAGKAAAKAAAEKAAAELGNKIATEAAKKVANETIKKSSEKIAEETAKTVAEKTTEQAAAESAKQSAKTIGSIIGCSMAFATGLAYTLKQPNKKEVEAANTLKEQTFVEKTQQLDDTVVLMDKTTTELADKADEAESVNSESNDNIVDEKARYDMLKSSYLALQAKANSGEALAEEEKYLFEYVCKEMTNAGINIEDIQYETADNLTGIYDEMDNFQEDYDLAAENMGEVQGVTDFAESFDSTTKTMCYVEAAAQGLNVVSGTAAVIEATAEATAGSAAFGLGSWMWAFVAAGAAGVGMSVKGVAEQIKWGGKVDDEINARKDLTGMNAETNEIYEGELENFDVLKEGVEDLELEIPDDVSAPETTTLPNQETPGIPNGTPNVLKPNTSRTLLSSTTDNNNDDPNKDKLY